MIRFSFGMACLLIGVTCGGVALLANEPLLHPGPARLIPLLGEDQQNLVPNASFECGTDGWGSTELDWLLDWYGPLNGLFGRLDSSTATDGRQSLKIELTPENQPVEYDDYLHTQSRRIRRPAGGQRGLAGRQARPAVHVLGGHEGGRGRNAGAAGGAAIPPGPGRKTRATFDRLAALCAGVHSPGRGLLRTGRSRPAADKGVCPSAAAGNGLARCGAASAGHGHPIVRHPPADRTGSGHLQAGQYFRLA